MIRLATRERESLVDITQRVRDAVRRSGVKEGLVSIFAQGATCAVMIQEGWDENIHQDVIAMLTRMIPRGVWRRDQDEANGDAHLKAGLLGPSETLPVINGDLGLSMWQNILFCDFDGPHSDCRVMVTVISDS